MIGNMQPYTNGTFTIVSNSRSALQAIARPSNTTGQETIRKTLDKAEGLKNQGIQIELQWIPGRSGTPGSDAANKAAQEVAGLEEQHDCRRPLTSQKQLNKIQMLKEWHREWNSTEKGKPLRKIDHGLPSTHHGSCMAAGKETGCTL
jgi:hypothetical protein